MGILWSESFKLEVQGCLKSLVRFELQPGPPASESPRELGKKCKSLGLHLVINVGNEPKALGMEEKVEYCLEKPL